MEDTIEEVIPTIVREAIARNDGRCDMAALTEALAMAGRAERQRAAAAFIASLRSYGDSLDNYDQRDRIHTRGFVEIWERNVAEQIKDVPYHSLTEQRGMESRATTASFRIRIGARGRLNENMLIEAALAFARSERVLALVDTAQTARHAFADMERLDVHGNLLAWLAESYEAARKCSDPR